MKMCMICTDEIHTHEIAYAGHCMCNIDHHVECIEKWFQTIDRRMCPMCRRVEDCAHPEEYGTRRYANSISEKIILCLNRGNDWMFGKVRDADNILMMMSIMMVAIAYNILCNILILGPLSTSYLVEIHIILRLQHIYNVAINRWNISGVDRLIAPINRSNIFFYRNSR